MSQAKVFEWTPSIRAAAYAQYVGWIDREEDNWEPFAWEALSIRDKLVEQWEQLTAAERETVSAADDLLAANHARLTGTILPAPTHHPPSAWWWFLDLGPDVRDEASLRARLIEMGETIR